MTSRISSSTDMNTDKTGKAPDTFTDTYTDTYTDTNTNNDTYADTEADSMPGTDAMPETDTVPGTDTMPEMNIKPYKNAGFFVRQRELARRRLWPIALTFLSCLIYNVVCTATMLSNTLELASINHFPASRLTFELQYSLRSLLGKDNFSWFLLTLPIAAMLAIEGFAWMDNRRDVDFYESLPVPRRQRFFDICIGSFLYFTVSYIFTLEIGLLIAGAFGALSRAVLMEIVLAAVKMTAFFIAIYALGVLSAMLTGNVVIACFAFCTLLIYEMLFRQLLRGYCSEFFSTWSGRPSPLLSESIFSPLEHYVRGSSGTLEATLRLLALGALFFLLSWICMRLRRNERAGSAVVFEPVCSVVRVAMSLFIGLFAGLVILSLRTRNGIMISVIWTLLFTVITACIMQIIYEYDFRALFHKPLEIAAAVVLALLLYMGFVFDVTGYDRFVPDPDKVADAAFVCTHTSSDYCTEDGEPVEAEIYGEKYMHLDNVDDVIAIAEYGQEFTRQADSAFIQTDSGQDPFTESESTDQADMTQSKEEFELLVVYHMKNGTTVSRKFRLPGTMDPAMMNAVVGTEQFREGTFAIYHDKYVRSISDKFMLQCSNGKDELFQSLTAEEYEAFRKAYIADLEAFSYSFARENVPVARVTFSRETMSQQELLADGKYISVSHPVYPSFTNTIAVLKSCGVWTEPLDYTFIQQGLYNYEALSADEQALFDTVDTSVFSGPFNNIEDKRQEEVY